ncbi:hypothetical protein PTKIN_Ptkin10aG0040300 [Pterospermum kingtungense]
MLGKEWLKLQDICLVKRYKRVSDYWIIGVWWDWNLLQDLLASPILSKLAVVLVIEDDDEVDGTGWIPTTSREFIVKSSFGL